MAQVAAEFHESVEHYEGTVAARTAGFWNRLSVPLAASRGDASLQRLASHLESSPLRMAGLVTRLDEYDPVSLAAVAGKRSLQDLSGVTPEGGRIKGPPTMLEVVARKAAERHWERCRVDPDGAKRAEARWAGQRARLREGHLADALDAVETTYGTACAAERQAAQGRRVTVAPPAGYRPKGEHRLAGLGSERWKRLTDEAAVRTRPPKDWRFRAESVSHDRPRLLYFARGAGRAEQLAGSRFAPRVHFSRYVLRRRLASALARGPVATRRLLTGIAANPRRTAAALSARLDPVVVAAAIGPHAVRDLLAGTRTRHPGNLGKLLTALEDRDYQTLGAVRRGPGGALPKGVGKSQYRRAVSGDLQGGAKSEMGRLSAKFVNGVCRGRDGTALDVYDDWRRRRADVASGVAEEIISRSYQPIAMSVDVGRGREGSFEGTHAGGRPGTRGPGGDRQERTGEPAPDGESRQPPPDQDRRDERDERDERRDERDERQDADGDESEQRRRRRRDPGGEDEREETRGGPGGGDSRRAVIHVPPEALVDVKVSAADLPKVTRLEDGSWQVHDDPYVDRVIERPDGSYDVVLHEGVSATVAVEPAAIEAASGAHKRRTDPELVRLQNIDSEQAVADLRKASVDSLAEAVEKGTSSFERERSNFTAALAFDPASGETYDGLDGQVLRTQAGELGYPDDGRFATRAEIEAAGGKVRDDAEGVVVLRDQAAAGQPFGRNGKLDMDADPVTFTVRTPVVLYHVAAQTDPPPKLPVVEPARPARAANLQPLDLVHSLGVPVEAKGEATTRYEPPSSLLGADGKPTAKRPEAVVLGEGEAPMQQRSRLLKAAVDAAFVSSEGRSSLPRPGSAVYTPRGGGQADDVRRAEEAFVKACVVDRVASRIGTGYSPEKPFDELRPGKDRHDHPKDVGDENRKAFAEILRDPVRLDKLSREADRVADWVVDGAKDRLHERGLKTAHERSEESERRDRERSDSHRNRQRQEERQPDHSR